MNKLWLDFESFWSDDFTLKKLSPIQYINDHRFEALGCGFVDERDNRIWVDGPDLPKVLAKIDWPNTMAISHNALFDGLILSRRYDIIPGMYGDTLSMARNWLSYQLTSLSLASLSKYYGLPEKMGTVMKTKGVNFLAMTRDPALHAEVKLYGVDDAAKCKWIFEKMLADGFPEGELEVIDMVIRMVTQPKFKLDAMVLAEHLAKVKADKQTLLDAAMIESSDVSSIMSDQQLATKLLFLGVNPIPQKVSKTTGKKAFAFAKTDKDFQALLEHDEPLVQALVAARLGVKSTLEETRTERLLAIDRVVDGMPVPLRYSGAHTHRFSGDWNINLQNLPRGGELRKAFRAPDGMKVVAVDASQIEARFNATMAGEWGLVEQFRDGEDVYASFAENIYGYKVDKEHNKIERFVGKTGILSLGYGSSWPVFQNMCRIQGDVKLTDVDAARIVSLYRNRYRNIVNNWNRAQNEILQYMEGWTENQKPNELAALKPVQDPREGNWWGSAIQLRNKTLLLPNGNSLRYRGLKHILVDGKWTWAFQRGANHQKVYGAKLVENVIQALSFIHIMEVALRVKHITRGALMPVHQVHDELLYIVDDANAELVKRLVVREMSRAPEWMPEAPLAAEGHIGQTYYDAK